MKRMFAVAGLFFSASLFAQQAPQLQTEEIVVSASRISERRADALRDVDVISEEEIAASGQQTLVELLRARGGVEIASNGGPGQVSAVFMRGAESRHTLVLVDGIRVDSVTTGGTAFENIPLAQIERVEVVAGPLSSLYGTDAIGGVIQIFTRRGDGAHVRAGYGTYDTRELAGGINRRVRDTELGLKFGYLATDGFSATKPSIPFGQHNPDDDAYRNRNLSARIAHHFTPDFEAGANVFHSEGDTDFDAGLFSDDINHQNLSAYSIYSRNRINAVWQSLLRLGRGRDDIDVAGAFSGDFRTTQDQLTWQNDFKLGPGSLIAGLEYLAQEVESGSVAFTEDERNIRSFFGGYRGDFGRHGAQLNVRNDDNSQFGNQTTGSVGYGYRITPDFRIAASAGTAFKAPTFNDLYFPPFFGFMGNPNLRPERSRSFDIGFDYRAGNQRFGATYFHNRINDLIVAVFDPVTFEGVPQNVNRARIRGVEIAYRFDLGSLSFGARATLQEPKNADTGDLLPRRARRFGSIDLAKSFGPLRFGGEIVASDERFDSAIEAPTSKVGGYGILNLTAAYALARDWSITARWSNVFDRDYELVQHFNTPGSNVFVALHYQMK